MKPLDRNAQLHILPGVSQVQRRCVGLLTERRTCLVFEARKLALPSSTAQQKTLRTPQYWDISSCDGTENSRTNLSNWKQSVECRDRSRRRLPTSVPGSGQHPRNCLKRRTRHLMILEYKRKWLPNADVYCNSIKKYGSFQFPMGIAKITVTCKLCLCWTNLFRRMGEWINRSTFSWPRHWLEVSGVSFTSRLLYHQGENPRTHWLVRPHSRTGQYGEIKNSFHPTGNRTPTHRSSSPQPVDISTALILITI
jgi:hypothetical protein